MKTLFFLVCIFAASLLYTQVVVPSSLTTCGEAESPSWVESGIDKLGKLQLVVLPSAGVTDTANVSARFSMTRAYLYDAAHPELFPGAEVLNFFGTQYAFYKWQTIFRIDHILSKCSNINDLLLYYGFGDGVYYIEFYQNGKHLNTSAFQYSTPIGFKPTITFPVYHF